jgi:hypothetical protein
MEPLGSYTQYLPYFGYFSVLILVCYTVARGRFETFNRNPKFDLVKIFSKATFEITERIDGTTIFENEYATILYKKVDILSEEKGQVCCEIITIQKKECVDEVIQIHDGDPVSYYSTREDGSVRHFYLAETERRWLKKFLSDIHLTMAK